MSQERSDKMTILRWLCQLAWADGELHPDEKAHLQRLSETLGLTQNEMAEFNIWMEKCPDWEPGQKPLPSRKDRQYLLLQARLLASADRKVLPEEEALIAKLVETQGLTPDDVSFVNAVLNGEAVWEDEALAADLGGDSSGNLPVLANAARKALHERASQVKPEDEDRIRKEFPKKAKRAEKAKAGFIKRMLENLKLLYEMVMDPEFVISWETKATIIGAIAYFISPIDLIPDPLPVLGWVDDALVVAWAMHLVSKDVARYKQFRNRKEGRQG